MQKLVAAAMLVTTLAHAFPLDMDLPGVPDSMRRAGHSNTEGMAIASWFAVIQPQVQNFYHLLGLSEAEWENPEIVVRKIEGYLKLVEHIPHDEATRAPAMELLNHLHLIAKNEMLRRLEDSLRRDFAKREVRFENNDLALLAQSIVYLWLKVLTDEERNVVTSGRELRKRWEKLHNDRANPWGGSFLKVLRPMIAGYHHGDPEDDADEPDTDLEPRAPSTVKSGTAPALPVVLPSEKNRAGRMLARMNRMIDWYRDKPAISFAKLCGPVLLGGIAIGLIWKAHALVENGYWGNTPDPANTVDKAFDKHKQKTPPPPPKVNPALDPGVQKYLDFDGN